MAKKGGQHAHASIMRNAFLSAFLATGVLLSPGCRDPSPVKSNLNAALSRDDAKDLLALEGKMAEIRAEFERNSSFFKFNNGVVLRCGDMLYARKGMHALQEGDFVFAIHPMFKHNPKSVFPLTKMDPAGVWVGGYRVKYGMPVELPKTDDLRMPTDLTLMAFPGLEPKTAYVMVTYPSQK
ncbi:MAG: hypothetical protein V1827_04730 [Candidatus Micrarchaeota archaeon]